MLSRAADSMYWMARNIERAESSARLIDVNMVSMLENSNPEEASKGYNWQDILDINGDYTLYSQNHQQMDTRSVIHFLSLSSTNYNSILQNVEYARENARIIRGMIPLELWELLNSFYLRIKQYPNIFMETEDIRQFLQMVKDQSIHYQGIVESIMFRGDAFTFIKLGKYLERAEKMARILDVYYHKKTNGRFNKEIVDHHQWSSVLHAVSGYEAYINKYRSYLEPERIMDFLLFDDTFPRSIRYCVEQLMKSFEELEKKKVQHYNRDLFMVLGKLHADIKFGSIDEVIEHDSRKWFGEIKSQCDQIGKLICKTYYLGELDGKWTS